MLIRQQAQKNIGQGERLTDPCEKWLILKGENKTKTSTTKQRKRGRQKALWALNYLLLFTINTKGSFGTKSVDQHWLNDLSIRVVTVDQPQTLHPEVIYRMARKVEMEASGLLSLVCNVP